MDENPYRSPIDGASYHNPEVLKRIGAVIFGTVIGLALCALIVGWSFLAYLD